jgi:hypothetical protein
MERDHFPKKYNYFRWGDDDDHYNFYITEPLIKEGRAKFSWRQRYHDGYCENSTDWFGYSKLSVLVRFMELISYPKTFRQFIKTVPQEVDLSFKRVSYNEDHECDDDVCACLTMVKASLQISDKDCICVDIEWIEDDATNEHIVMRHNRLDDIKYTIDIDALEMSLIARNALASLEA